MSLFYKLLWLLVALSATILIQVGCVQKSEQETILTDYNVSANPTPEFMLAQSLRNRGAFDKADSVYGQLLQDSSIISSEEKEYIRLNQLLCRFAANDTTYIDSLLDGSTFSGLRALVKGVQLMRKDRSGFSELHKARLFLKKEGLTQSIYYCLLLEQLGLAHRQKGSYIDSVSYYYVNALDTYNRYSNAVNNKGRLLMRMALTSLLHRNEINGIGYLDQAMELASTKEQVITLLIYRSTLLRKLHRYPESDAARQKAEEYLALHPNPSLKFLLYQEKALMGVHLKDSIFFNNALSELDRLTGAVPGLSTYKHRLIGAYYNYMNIRTKEKLFHYELALKGLKKERVPDTKIVFESLAVLMSGYLTLNDLDRAEQYAYEGLVYATPLSATAHSFEHAVDPVVQMETYNFINYDILAMIYFERYKQTKGKSHLENAFQLYTIIDSLIISQVRAQEEESVLTFLQIGHGIYSNALKVCHALYSHNPEMRWIESAHVFMERSKSMSIHQDILKHDESYFPTVPPSIKKKELELRTRLTYIKRQNLTLQSQQLQELVKEQDVFFKTLERDFPEYYLARYSPTITTAGSITMRAVKEKKSVLNYHLTDNLLFVVRYDQNPEFLQIPLPTAFADSLAQLRQLLSQPTPALVSFKRLSYSSYKTLLGSFKKLQEHIEVVPEGVLNHMPFEVLISDTIGNYKTLPYLIKKHTISYSFSLKLATATSEQSIDRIVSYAFSSDDTELPALPGATREVKTIFHVFPDAKHSTRNEQAASRAQFLSDLELDIDLLHISMHAASDPNNRLNNAIYFPSRDGIDTVFGFEIVPKDVKAHTVVLTSCQSASGAIVPGEGTYSLARAFQQTGVNHVIASLWSIPDYSSPLICEAMYEEIKAGSSPAFALAHAKRLYLDKMDTHLSNPLYWAGLITYSR